MSTQKFHDISDNELLEKFYHDHNNDWLGILFPRYTLLLLGVCMKYLKNEDDAKDAVQQTFLKSLSELHKYKVDYFKSWIYIIAKNHCLMKLRDKGKLTLEINEHFNVVDESDDIHLLVKKNNTLDQLNAALQHLNKEQQLCVTLFYFKKKSYTEISEHTGFNIMQVKSYIQNGKRNLRILLESEK